ncbi:hypothetical protein [Pseudomonas aeruginosa]
MYDRTRMSAKILSVSPGVNNAPEFHYVISDEEGTQQLEGVLTLEEARSIAERKSYGGVYNMCRAILETTDYESLVGARFEN